jgi:hypothetical protein
MPTLRTTRTPASKCPDCGKRLNAATSLEGDIQPTANNALSVCIACGALLKYGVGLIPELLSKSEMGTLPTSTLELLLKAQGIVFQMKQQRQRAKFRDN